MYWDFIRNLISFDVIVCVKFSFDVIIVEDKIQMIGFQEIFVMVDLNILVGFDVYFNEVFVFYV